jgi:hypothetical protein
VEEAARVEEAALWRKPPEWRKPPVEEARPDLLLALGR